MTIYKGENLDQIVFANKREIYYNEMRSLLLCLDALTGTIVVNSRKSNGDTTPSNPANGDAYILYKESEYIGAWSQFNNHPTDLIVVWSQYAAQSGTNTLQPKWIGYTPKEGWVVVVKEGVLPSTLPNSIYQFEGTTFDNTTVKIDKVTSRYYEIGDVDDGAVLVGNVGATNGRVYIGGYDDNYAALEQDNSSNTVACGINGTYIGTDYPPPFPGIGNLKIGGESISDGSRNLNYRVVQNNNVTSRTLTDEITFFTGTAAASFALTFLPASIDIDGKTQGFVSDAARTNITYSSTGATFQDAPTSTSAGEAVYFLYTHATAKWRRTNKGA